MLLTQTILSQVSNYHTDYSFTDPSAHLKMQFCMWTSLSMGIFIFDAYLWALRIGSALYAQDNLLYNLLN